MTFEQLKQRNQTSAKLQIKDQDLSDDEISESFGESEDEYCKSLSDFSISEQENDLDLDLED